MGDSPVTARTARIVLTLLLTASVAAGLVAQATPLPNRADSLKFAAIGDNGTGEREQ